MKKTFILLLLVLLLTGCDKKVIKHQGIEVYEKDLKKVLIKKNFNKNKNTYIYEYSGNIDSKNDDAIYQRKQKDEFNFDKHVFNYVFLEFGYSIKDGNFPNNRTYRYTYDWINEDAYVDLTTDNQEYSYNCFNNNINSSYLINNNCSRLNTNDRNYNDLVDKCNLLSKICNDGKKLYNNYIYSAQ